MSFTAPWPYDFPQPAFDPPLDAGISRFVEILSARGIETYESCQGGRGHAGSDPFVKFHGNQCEGFRALAVAHDFGLPVARLRRVWDLIDGEPTGPTWEMTFYELTDGTNPWAQRRASEPLDPLQQKER